MHRFRNTRRPLQEKMALFWHHVFATGYDKVVSARDMSIQVELFRSLGMGSFRDLLVELARNPAMIYWLDNQENHKRAPNENWGRELLELFSMGVGNYTEKDVYECARAFTGWSMGRKLSYMAWTGLDWQFVYRPEDHDGSEKSFLGHSGRFGGEDVIDIIVEQPACHAFIARHLYNFFVADEPEVPRWPSAPPRDPGCRPAARRYLRRVGLRDTACPAGAVQLRLLQGGPLPEDQEPGGGRDRHLEAHR